MSDAPSLYARHHRLAGLIAKDFFLPDAGNEDIVQEARMALWEACRSYDKTRGKFPTFASRVIKNHLTDLVRVQTKRGRAPRQLPLFDEDHEAPEPPPSLEPLLAGFRQLPPSQRRAVTNMLNGVEATSSKAHEVALYNARKNLRRLAA